MKNKQPILRFFLATLLSIIPLIFVSYASAATLTWDANGSTGPNPADGGGSWTTADNWWDGAANVTWTAANDAVFGAGTDGTYFINVAGLASPSAQTIRFSNSGYVLTNSSPVSVTLSSTTGGTLPQIRVDAGKTGTVGTNVIVESSVTTAALYLGQNAATAGGTLNIANGGIVRGSTSGTAAQGHVFIDGDGTVVNVMAGGTLAERGTSSGLIVGGQSVGATNTLNVDGGIVTVAGTTASTAGFLIGFTGNAIVTVTNGGTVTLPTTGNGVYFGRFASSGTFNLDGGTVSTPIVKKGTGVGAVATFNFNGGTLKALANQTAFMTNLTTANVKPGGAVIDDSGFAITIGQALLDGAPSGGLIKLGAGTLTLLGANTYTGGTIVSNGMLKATSLGTGNVAVRSGVVLSVGNSNAVATLPVGGNLDLNASTLVFDVTNTTTLDLITVAGNLTVAGTTTIALPNPLPLANGDYTLMEVTGTMGGSVANFSVASVSPKTYTIVYQAGTPNKVVLQVSGGGVSNFKTWIGDGVVNQWNVNSGLDWVETGGSVPVVFTNGNVVTFDDTATNLTVNINTTVSPAAMNINSTKEYFFTGSGAITGTNALTVAGSGTNIINLANTYTGGTALQGTALLVLTNSRALGTGPLNLKSSRTDSLATVQLAGGITVTNTMVMDTTTGREAFYNVSGDNILVGPLTITGSGARALIFQNEAGLGSLFTVSSQVTATNFNENLSLRGSSGNLGLVTGQINITNTAGNSAISQFQINGAANWTIASTNNSWLVTYISGANGGLILGANNALATSARVQFDGATSGFLDLAGFNQTVLALHCASTTGSPVVGNSSTTSDSVLRIAGGIRSFIGAVVDTIGSGTRNVSVEVVGGAVQELTGNNTYTGPTTISNANLRVSSPGSLAAGSAVTVKTNGILSGNGVVNGPVTVNSGGALTAGTANAGTLTLASLTLGATGSDTQTINVTVNNSLSVVAGVAVTGGLTNNGTTTIAFTSATNFGVGTYFGLVTYTGDTITNGFAVALPARVVGTLEYTPGSINLNVTSAVFDAPKWSGAVSGIWDTNTANWTLITGGTPTTYVNIPTSDAVLFDDTLTGTSNVVLNTTVNPAGMTVTNTTTAYSIAGVGSIAGSGSLTKTGTNRLTLSTSNTFTGAVSLSGGSVVINNGNALGSGPKVINAKSTAGQFSELHLNGSGGAVILPAELTFNVYGDSSFQGNIVNDSGNNVVNGPIQIAAGGGHPKFTVNGGSLALNGKVSNIQNANRILQLAGTSSGSGTVAGVIEDDLDTANALTYVDILGGTWTLANPTNTYSGLTRVATNGTLVVSGTIPASPLGVVVQNGGTLKGTGIINASTTNQLGGMIAPGNSIGTLTVNNNLTLQGTAIMEIARNGAGLTNDLIKGINTNTYGGTLIVTNIGSSPLQVGDAFKLFAATNYSGTFASIVYPSGYTFTDNLATSGTITVLTVPATTPPPAAINQVSVSGGNLIVQGTNGAAGGTYSILQSTNVALPLSSWTTNKTGTFTGSGTFSNTIPVGTDPQRFFNIKQP